MAHPAGDVVTGEDRLIAWLRGRLRLLGEDLLGDDGAVVPDPRLDVVTVDQQIAGIHFPADLEPRVVARRLVAVGLSDLAAMGARPRYGFVALTVPRGFAVRRFFDALLEACTRTGLSLAGGDVARGRALAAALTVCGRRYPRGRLVRRRDARPGDSIWVGDTLGESAAGRLLVDRGARLRGRGVRLPDAFVAGPALARAARRAVRRHLEPTPQLRLGRWLAGRRRAAAIDVSDGLAVDLHRLCRESGVGARVAATRLPVPPHFTELATALEAAPSQLVLGGGEDYALLFALPSGTTPPPPLGAHRIGEVTRARSLRLDDGGRLRPLPEAGWDHLS